MNITMPANGWRPRPHQMGLWHYFNDPVTKKFDGTGKRACGIMHRRWGKDEVDLQQDGGASDGRQKCVSCRSMSTGAALEAEGPSTIQRCSATVLF
jgi:hypothetical protein